MKSMESNSQNNRMRRIELRISEEDYHSLKDWQSFLEISTLSEVVRQLIRNGIAYKFDYSSVWKVTEQISKIGNNINQIARTANITNSVNAADIEIIKMDLEELEDIINDYVSKDIRAERMLSEYKRS